MKPPVGELEVVDDVTEAFADHVRHAFAHRPGPRFGLVLSGGPTARRCYQRLATAGGIQWAMVDVFIGDERCVPPDDDDANQKLVRTTLVEVVGPVGSFHPMSCAEGPDAYEQTVRSYPPPDVVHLGLGPDGHTASLFPDSSALAAPPQQLVALSADPHGHNAHDRMTLTLAGIARARLALFTVSSDDKHDALEQVCRGADLPAARVRAERVLWLVDRAAAGGDTA